MKITVPDKVKNLVSPKTFYLLVAALAVTVLLWYFGSSALKSFSNALGNRQDVQSEQTVKEDLKQAGTHEDNANAASVSRQVNEARAADAQADKDAAAVNSNRTAEPTRQARQRYEKTRRHDPADAPPAIPDSELCSELAKRNLPCPR